MSQATDYAVANASGASVRADINSIFAAVASANSGTAEPSTMYSFMIWVDTTNNVVKLRNGANDAWLTMPFSMTASNTVDINGGTVDGATIGANSASTIVGTTIVANTSLNIASDGATVTGIKDEDNMSSNSAVKLATQQSIKAYVDSQVGTVDTLAEILANGNTTAGTDLAVSAGDDITFTDSSKALFGATSDLQIYHDGSNSYVKDSGTGDLYLQGEANVRITDADGNKMFLGQNGGEAQLYYDGSEKLATVTGGIDVTGTVVCDGGNFDGAATFNDSSADVDFRVESNGNTHMLFIDGGNDAVGVGVSDPAATLQVLTDGSGNAIRIEEASGGEYYDLGVNSYGSLEIKNSDTLIAEFTDSNGFNTYGNVVFNENSADLDFRVESNGSANMLFVDGGNDAVGIGTGSPSFENGSGLEINYSAGNGAHLKLTDSASGAGGTNGFDLYAFNTSGYIENYEAGSIVFRNGGSERMRIDSSGQVGIGTSSPSADTGVARFLQIGSSSDAHAGLVLEDNSGQWELQNNGNLSFWHDGTTEAVVIDSSGNVGIGAVPEATETGWTNVSIGGLGTIINSTSANAGGRTQLILMEIIVISLLMKLVYINKLMESTLGIMQLVVRQMLIYQCQKDCVLLLMAHYPPQRQDHTTLKQALAQVLLLQAVVLVTSF